MKLRISLRSLNWAGMLVAAIAGFGTGFGTGATTAVQMGEHSISKVLVAGTTAGAAAAAGAVWGVFTQRTNPDGAASPFPGITSTDTAYSDDPSEPVKITAGTSVWASAPIPVPTNGTAATLMQVATQYAQEQQAKEQARAAEIAATRAKLARLESGA